MPIAPPSISTSTAIATLDSEFYWGSGAITFSIPTTGSTWPGYAAGSEPFTSYSTLNAAQATQFRLAIQQWDELIANSFTEVTEPGSTGNIRVAFTAIANANTWGYATFPPYQGGSAGFENGDIWIDTDYTGSDFAKGGYDFIATLHEIGHALGLDHPFESSPPLATEYDNYRYSIMSYTSPVDKFQVILSVPPEGGVSASYTGVYSRTPSMFDIAAVQQMYGADTTTRSGASTYTWNENQAIMETIYDAGGVDTWNLSTHTRRSDIDLAPGAFSSIAEFTKQQQIDAAVAVYGEGYRSFFNDVYNENYVYTWSNNVGIALNTTIENVFGGSAGDTIRGNSVANELRGNGGNDWLYGRDGADNLQGGANNDNLFGGTGGDIHNGGDGLDYARYDDAVYGNLTVSLQSTSLNTGAALGDTYISIEGVILGGGNDILYGNTGINYLYGGAGNDMIYGGLGADRLDGGTGFDYARYDDASYGNLIVSMRTPGINTGAAAGDTYFGIEGLMGGSGNDQLTGDDLANYIYGRNGNDYIYGSGGGDSLFGEDGNDYLYGGLSADVHNGGAGFDYARYDDASYGNLVINMKASGSSTGAALGDTYVSIEGVMAGSGNDTITALDTGMYIYGFAGTDTITGGNGIDRIFGGNDADRINGGLGSDVLNGEAGVDTFVFTAALGASNIDSIVGFVVGQDKFELENSTFTMLAAGNLAGTAFTIGSAATASSHRIIYNSATGALLYDADGNTPGGVAAVQFATLATGLNSLTEASFTII